VPCHGDFTVLRDLPFIVDADVLVGGTPCQAFSVAGLRNSLADERGNLSLEFVRLADAIDDVRRAANKPEAIIVWENVPGVLSVKDNAFGCFLAALAGEDDPLVPPRGKWTNAGVVDGPKRKIAWRVLDAQYFGLAQRRRRVFVVASSRDGFDPAEVLFELEGVQRHSAPSREAGQAASAGTASRAGERSSHWDGDFPHPTLNQSAKVSGGVGSSNQELFSQRGAYLAPAHPVVMAHGQANAEIRTDGGTPALTCIHEAPIDAHSLRGEGYPDPAYAITAGAQGKGGVFGSGRDGQDTFVTHSLRGEGFDASEDGTGRGTPLVPVLSNDPAHAICANEQRTYTNEGSMFQLRNVVGQQTAVRRLTPTECSRLQGFPDEYLMSVTWRGKCPPADGVMYKALGNSMAVPCMRWIGERIQRHLRGET
jgi:DNA (cytosine-5)-methyltransferase 1